MTFETKTRAPQMLSKAGEIIAMLDYFANDFAQTFGAERAMVHISELVSRIVPLINLEGGEDINEDLLTNYTVGIQDVLLTARGSHGPEMKIRYIRMALSDPFWFPTKGHKTRAA